MNIRRLCAALVLSVVGTGFGQSPPALVPPEDFAILPWGGTPNNPKLLESIRECGFNLAGFVGPDALDAVQAAGLKAIVSHGPLHVTDPNVDQATADKRVAEIVERVGKHPAVYGYYLRDEPSADHFPALGRFAEAVRKADPDARAYINLFPNYANETQLGTATYAEYLEKFITTVQPPFVSYDNYSLMGDGSLRGGYFENLEAVRKAALAHKLPFWNIVLSNGHFTYAEPSEDGLRFQAFTTLACGARGISYFTYFTPPHGNYRLAPIDQFGNKTATWDMLRRINLQINALAPTLARLQSINVFHHPDVPKGSQGLVDSKFVAEISGSGSFLVGEFEDAEGEAYVMAVNKSLHQSTTLSVEFKKPGKVTHINNYTGKPGGWSGEDLWLAPGQGALLHVKD